MQDILPQSRKTYAIIPGIKMGMLSADVLEKLARLCRHYEAPAVKITSAQRVAFLGLEPEKLNLLRRELDIPDTLPHTRNRIHYIQACPGIQYCRYGIGNSLAVGRAIERLELPDPLPAKVKVGVSGCRMCCCESWVRDVGLVAQKKGWKLIFGGNCAGRPRIGDVVAENLGDHEAVALVEKCLTFYIQNARFKTRSARFMERTGIEQLKKGVGLS